MKASLIVCVVLGLALVPASAWWSTGHMIVARIAYDELKMNNPAVLETATTKLETLKPYSHDGKYTFIEAATWPDSIKSVHWTAFNDWHFINQAYMNGYQGMENWDPHNVTVALAQSYDTLKGEKSGTDKMAMLGESFMLTYMLHLVGDIHQPLHVTEMFSDKFPHGDLGGNRFKIDYSSSIDELHALWDSCMDQYGSHYAPISDATWEQFGNISKTLSTAHPRSEFADMMDKDWKFTAWATEGYNNAVNQVYKGITPGGKVSDEYLKAGRDLVNKLLPLAGYRLADQLVRFYNPSSTSSPVKAAAKDVKTTDVGKLLKSMLS